MSGCAVGPLGKSQTQITKTTIIHFHLANVSMMYLRRFMKEKLLAKIELLNPKYITY